MTSTALMLVLGGLLAASFAVVRVSAQAWLHKDPVVYGLWFPGDRLLAADVLRVLVVLEGLVPPVWLRAFVQPMVTFETVGTPEGIVHRLVVPRSARGLVESAMQAHLPAVRWEPIDDAPIRTARGAEYGTSTEQRPLRTDPAGLSAELLANVQPLDACEEIVVQVMLSPTGPIKPPRLADRGDGPVALDAELLANAEALGARKAKVAEPLLAGIGRIAVRAATSARADALVRQVEGAWRGGTRSPGVQVQRRAMPRSWAGARARGRTIPLTRFPLVVNVEEAASLIGWPIEVTALPGLDLGGSRLLPVPNAVGEHGAVVGMSTFPGTAERRVAVADADRTRHLACIGPTGTGKSTLLSRLIAADMEAGHAVVLLDPKGDLVETVCELIPEQRLDDVIVLDASDDERPVGYNPLASTPENRELVVEECLGVMRTIWADFWGPRTDEITRGALMALAAHDDMTLAEIPSLLTMKAFRSHIVDNLDDGGVKHFWAAFEAWSARERNQAIAPIQNKARSITMRPRLRGVFGQSQGIDLADIIAGRKILLVNLAAGAVGTEAAYLLGALVFAGLWNAVRARANKPADERPPVMAYLDEFQHLVALPTPADEVLAESRGYGMALHLVTQHLAAIDTDLQRATLNNARSKVAFQATHRDAAIFSKEFGTGLAPEDLLGLGSYEAVAKLYANGAVQPACTIRTLPPPRPLRSAAAVKDRSRQRHGTPREQVEAAMAARVQNNGPTPAKAVGTRRRASS